MPGKEERRTKKEALLHFNQPQEERNYYELHQQNYIENALRSPLARGTIISYELGVPPLVAPRTASPALASLRPPGQPDRHRHCLLPRSPPLPAAASRLLNYLTPVVTNISYVNCYVYVFVMNFNISYAGSLSVCLSRE